MNDFFTGLQFLTRIRLVRQTEWSPESFGRSVKFFPVIGAIIGLVLVGAYFLLHRFAPVHIMAAGLILLEIIVTGGLHCDGFMDTMDGIFSGRSRERMLEIMKDSRVGSNGVVGFVLLILVKWSLYVDLAPEMLPVALVAMPLIARMAMVIGITVFPYGRPDGIGKAFAQYATSSTFYVALTFTLLLLGPLGYHTYIAALIGMLFAIGFARYVTDLLGGLTGDVYGAIAELTEVAVLFIFLFL